ncbi:MAG: hypothetical protein SFU85_12055 [Candidatus Methylacidiphilales bacterium]|nr:hypothetical protein [Candidatus Methylacidiphilales bacterium]
MERLCAWLRLRPWLAPAAFVLLVLAIRFKYLRQMALDGLPYLADADCYTRMERVRHLLADGCLFRASHPWENAPVGITTHATALLDLLIATPALIFLHVSPQALDWTGWTLPPLLAATAGWALWRLTASPVMALGWTRWPILLTFALHPLTVWANSVGRPDHQALVVPLLAVALVLEILRSRDPHPAWPWVAGACWGTALWVSLYEPLLLFIPTFVLVASIQRRAFGAWLGATALVALPAWFLEGWRWSNPVPLWQDPHLSHWLAMIGELKSPPPWQWLSLLAILPALGWGTWSRWVARRYPSGQDGWPFDRLYPWVITLVLAGLSLWQQRWMALLPFPLAWAAFSLLRDIRSTPWHVGLITLHLLPMVAWTLWELPQIQPPKEAAQMRQLAGKIGATGNLLGPWWLSPALLHFSGRPVVASSSHQSLAGNLDSARFFTTKDFTEADAILQRRRVEWIAVYRPERTFANARQLLEGPKADLTIDEKDFYRYVILRLWDVKMIPPRYRLAFASPDWRLYHYQP